MAFGRIDLDAFLKEVTDSAPADTDLDSEVEYFRNTLEFLGVDLAFGGAAPDTSTPGAYRRLADDLADWARGRGEAAWQPH